MDATQRDRKVKKARITRSTQGTQSLARSPRPARRKVLPPPDTPTTPPAGSCAEQGQPCLQPLLQAAQLGVLFTRNERIVHASPHCEALFGHALKALQELPLAQLFASDLAYRGFIDQTTASAAAQTSWQGEVPLQHAGTGVIWCRITVNVMAAEAAGGGAPGALWLIENITAARAVREDHAAALTELGAIFGAVPVGIAVVREGRIVHCNPRFQQLFGHEEGGGPGLLGESPRALYASQEDYLAAVSANQKIREGAPQRNEQQLRRRDGSGFWASVSGCKFGGGRNQGSVWIIEDITERHQAKVELERARDELERRVDERTAELSASNEQLRREIAARAAAQEIAWHSAHYDALTDLPNRTLLLDRLDQSISQSNRYRRRLGLMCLDLDRFQAINDSLGHDVGDELLKRVGERLLSQVRQADTVARTGGDEFVILIGEIEDTDAALCVAQKILDTFALPFDLPVAGGVRSVSISASIGISVFPDHGADPHTLLKSADAAVYAAKESGRNGYCLVSSGAQHSTQRHFELEQRLRGALSDGQLSLHYQAQYDTRTRMVCGMEALIRWNDPVSGMVSPAEFIPLAEETGLILPMGAWVLKEALRQNHEWQRWGYPAVPVSVNLSLRQFRQHDLVESIAALLEETGYPAHLLKLEITESTLMRNLDSTLVKLETFSRMGIQLALDDFGTGYSSLNQLKDLPSHQLKIDRSFICDLAPDQERANAIIRAIIGLAKGLNLEIVVEGVETKEQVGMMQAHGCSKFQGFYFARPQAAHQVGNIFSTGG